MNRRRFLTISAAVLALPQGAAAKATNARWKGAALGAPASVILAGISQTEARPVFARLEMALDRLEGIFSLYRPESALSRLNRDGRLQAPPPELLEVLSQVGALHEGSEGAFDPTVQPLWQALATGGDAEAAQKLVGWEGVHLDAPEIRLSRPGMALTLNGIAQGYVTDQIAALLRREGFGNVVVDIGEIAASGAKPGGAAWQAGISDVSGRILHRVALRDRALATSAPQGTLLQSGQGHILDPHGAAPRQSLVAVSAPGAMLADGLSTALCLLDGPRGRALVSRFGDALIEYIAPA